MTESDSKSDGALVAANGERLVMTYWRALAILGALMLAAFLIVPFFFQPAEDATILFQYSANLAHTGVIGYIPNGPRAEGATDFLWMLNLAAGQALGISSYGLAMAITAEAIVLLAITLIKTARQKLTFWNTSAVVCLVMLAPQIFAAEAGFSVIPFALFLGTMTAAAYNKRYGWACAGALFLCLLRPDGAVFALPLLGVYLFEEKEFRSRLGKLLGIFVLPGTVYFLWRWHYFGHLLPLPFYVKSDTPRVAGFLVIKSAEGLAPPLLAACAILWIALRRKVFLRRNWLLVVTLIVPSSIFYMAMRLDQNYANRFFFYPLVVMAVMVAANSEHYRSRAGKVLLDGLGIWFVVLAYFWVNWLAIYTLDYPQPQVVAVARALGKLPIHGTMITSESGAIPYYSKWAAYDSWGLNTPEFATRLIQPSDVTRLRPDLVILHEDSLPAPCAAPTAETSPHHDRTWNNMAENVLAGMDPNGYTQWLLPEFNRYYRTHPRRWNGQQRWGITDYQCWFIRNDFPLQTDVVEILKRNGGISATDYEAAVRRSVSGVPLQ